MFPWLNELKDCIINYVVAISLGVNYSYTILVILHINRAIFRKIRLQVRLNIYAFSSSWGFGLQLASFVLHRTGWKRMKRSQRYCKPRLCITYTVSSYFSVLIQDSLWKAISWLEQSYNLFPLIDPLKAGKWFSFGNFHFKSSIISIPYRPNKNF